MDISEFSSPYYAGDGYEVQAIKNDKAAFFSMWSFPDDDNERHTISLMISSHVMVVLSYEDVELKEISDQQAKAKEIDDL